MKIELSQYELSLALQGVKLKFNEDKELLKLARQKGLTDTLGIEHQLREEKRLIEALKQAILKA